MSVAALLVNTCTITPNTYSQSTASGGPLFVPGTAVTGVTCKIEQNSGREFMEAMKETGKRFFDCYFPIGTVLAHTDRISAVTGNNIGGMSGAVLKVISPPIDHCGRGAYLFCNAEEIS